MRHKYSDSNHTVYDLENWEVVTFRVHAGGFTWRARDFTGGCVKGRECRFGNSAQALNNARWCLDNFSYELDSLFEWREDWPEHEGYDLSSFGDLVDFEMCEGYRRNSHWEIQVFRQAEGYVWWAEDNKARTARSIKHYPTVDSALENAREVVKGARV